MGEVKTFRVTGEIQKPKLQTSFRKMVVAAKREHAIEKVYAELGSRHRVKRFHIRILKVEEVPREEMESSSPEKTATGEKEVGTEG